MSLLAIGASAWWRGVVSGVWLAPWEIVVGFLALALALAGQGARAGRSGRGGRRAKPAAGRVRR